MPSPTSKYAELTDAVDPALNIEMRHLLIADVFVDGKLYERGINPEGLTLPIPLLTQITAAWACRTAAIEQAQQENSPLIAKAREYEKTTHALLMSINRAVLGLAEPANAGFGFATLGRN